MLKNSVYAAGLIDLAKAFETVPHAIIADMARAKGYPLALLRICLAAYRLDRIVGIEGIFSKKDQGHAGHHGGIGHGYYGTTVVVA